MADAVHIVKGGIQALEWDGEQRVETKVATALPFLRCECAIDADVTLGDIFRIVEQDTELARFLKAWTWCDLDAFHEEAHKPVLQTTHLAYIEIAKAFEWDEGGAHETIDVSGVAGNDDRGNSRYGLDFTPVNELAPLPVRLNTLMDIRRGPQKAGEAHCHFTLLNVLGEIYWEIGFYGSPASRDREREEIEAREQEIEDGRVECIPLESLIKEMSN
jgi:hypothetical protein